MGIELILIKGFIQDHFLDFLVNIVQFFHCKVKLTDAEDADKSILCEDICFYNHHEQFKCTVNW